MIMLVWAFNNYKKTIVINNINEKKVHVLRVRINKHSDVNMCSIEQCCRIKNIYDLCLYDR